MIAFTNRLNSRSEEHTSEFQSLRHLVCRLLLEKKPPPIASVPLFLLRTPPPTNSTSARNTALARPASGGFGYGVKVDDLIVARMFFFQLSAAPRNLHFYPNRTSSN